MQGSTDAFVQGIFPQEAKSKDAKVAVKSPAAAAAPGRPGNTASKKVTLAGQFREQLASLMVIISSTEPHFVRAIKPNNDKKPNRFEAVNALRQLRYSGLLETIKIRAAGFVFRPTFKEFYDRFKILVKGIDNQTKGMDVKKACEILLDELKIEKSRVQIGQTKLFMRENDYTTLHKLSEERLKAAAIKIQNKWRTWHLRKKFLDTQKGALILQTAIRAYYNRRDFRKVRREKEKKEREEREKKAKEEAERKEKEEKERKEKEDKDRMGKDKRKKRKGRS